ncbi:hypothetical protein [Paenibacillus brevis]|uniref:Glycosyltransferase RgtA/B/C/D-like domain-containing protein n=1 Tax=Paenibacillus brevis TaxID=2841508 RepID=A0ABS6FUE2_9BACL|nr:hypothetical protein [Paenibacillus brevis]MBU5673840.1 hypothetical protein [Paenibacillus brevis]
MKKTVFFSGVFFLYFYIFYNQIYNKAGLFPSDLPDHISFGQQFLAGDNQLPHPGLYLLIFLVSLVSPFSFEESGILTLSILVVLISWIIYRFLTKYTDKALEYTSVLMIVTPIFVPFFNQLYLGQSSANVYHNPTLIAVKPFVYLSLIYFIKMLEKPTLLNVVLTGFILMASTVMKPNFVLVFIFTAPLYMLIKNVSFNRWFLLMATLVPTGSLLIYQYFRTYNLDDGGKIVFDFLGVWNLYSPSPLLSVVLSLSFPLGILVFRSKSVWNSRYLLFSWIGTIIAYLQFAVLAEEGIRYTHANFVWGVHMMVALLFLFSVIELIKWKIEVGNGNWKQTLVQTILAFHFCSGLYYLIAIILGNSYI